MQIRSPIPLSVSFTLSISRRSSSDSWWLFGVWWLLSLFRVVQCSTLLVAFYKCYSNELYCVTIRMSRGQNVIMIIHKYTNNTNVMF
jgi:hypothetical protein